jgi:hypothetical protein
MRTRRFRFPTSEFAHGEQRRLRGVSAKLQAEPVCCNGHDAKGCRMFGCRGQLPAKREQSGHLHDRFRRSAGFREFDR